MADFPGDWVWWPETLLKSRPNCLKAAENRRLLPEGYPQSRLARNKPDSQHSHRMIHVTSRLPVWDRLKSARRFLAAKNGPPASRLDAFAAHIPLPKGETLAQSWHILGTYDFEFL
jgi:hypothetical protein